MINISGNLYNYWNEFGVQDKENILSINSCGFQKFITKNFTVSRNEGRADYQIIYIIKGRGFYTINNKSFEMGEGNMIIYPPHLPQHYTYNCSDSTELYWMHFSGCKCGEYMKMLGLEDSKSNYIGISSECIDFFKKIIYELQVKRPQYNFYTYAYLLELLSFMGRKMKELELGHRPKTDDAINKVIEIMHTRYNQEYSVGDFAKECNLSLFRFIHKFKSVTGCTPVEYITKIRINEAKKLLSDALLSVSEVSSIVGYDNPLYFSRMFRKIAGMPPSIYKKHPNQDQTELSKNN